MSVVKGIYNELHPGITMHKIPVKSGFPGVLFTIGVMAVYLMGIPDLIYFLVLAVVLGIGVAVMLRFIPRHAGLVMFVFTTIILVWLVGPSVMDDWRQEHEIDVKDLNAAIMAPPPPPLPREQSVFLCDSTAQRDADGQEGAQAQSPFDGSWEGKMHGLPGIALVVADADGGRVGGVVTFYLQMRDGDGKWRVAGKYAAPLLAVCHGEKTLTFDVQHHKAHGSPEFGPNVRFRMELSDSSAATLENLAENSPEPIKLTRRD